MKRLDQKGAAAMLSVVIFSIIITVVVTAYLRSAIVGQSESLNYDLSTRAYYSAESGVQDALRNVNASASLVSKPDCGSYVAVGANLGYTCQLIDTTPTSVEFPVSQDQNGMVRLIPAVDTDLVDQPNDPYNVIIRWSTKSESDINQYIARSVTADGTNNLFPSQANWFEGSERSPVYPALRVSLIDYPLSKTSIVRADIRQNVLFLNPTDQTSTLTLNAGGVTSSARVQSAKCYDTGTNLSFDGYMCQQVVRVESHPLSSLALFARIHSLYKSTDVQLSLAKQDSTNTIPLKGSVIEIDVTGKAGSTFRRVRQTFSQNNGVMLDNLPEAATIGGDGICKHYAITDNPADFKNPSNCF